MKLIQRFKPHSEKFWSWLGLSCVCWTGMHKSRSWKCSLTTNQWRWYARSQRQPQEVAGE